ncbi:MAG: polyprenyl synthetase family protein [Candidatus Hydrogenedens sp.]
MALTLTHIYKPIQEQILKVAEEVQKIWEDALKLVNIDFSMAPKAKGKLLRPAVCLLSAGAIGEEDLNTYISLGTAFELLHLASLTHDDVIDRAVLRRGGQSLNILWDNHAAVLGGDYLVARAIELLGIYKNYELIINAVQCVREMAEGELKFFAKPIETFTLEDCTELAKKKTAMLFARSASSSALIKKSPVMETLFRFGENIGIAFQFIDDLLDLTQDTNILGKPRYSDIYEQKVTLPILTLWNKLTDKEKEQFLHIFGKSIEKKEQQWLEQNIKKYKIEEDLLQHTERLKLTAIEELNRLPDSIYKDSLIQLCYFVVQREN